MSGSRACQRRPDGIYPSRQEPTAHSYGRFALLCWTRCDAVVLNRQRNHHGLCLERDAGGVLTVTWSAQHLGAVSTQRQKSKSEKCPGYPRLTDTPRCRTKLPRCYQRGTSTTVELLKRILCVFNFKRNWVGFFSLLSFLFSFFFFLFKHMDVIQFILACSTTTLFSRKKK